MLKVSVINVRLNRFRKYLNLKTYETFEDWNPDKETARAAELLYGHIDNMELYPGLMAEVTKPASTYFRVFCSHLLHLKIPSLPFYL